MRGKHRRHSALRPPLTGRYVSPPGEFSVGAFGEFCSGADNIDPDDIVLTAEQTQALVRALDADPRQVAAHALALLVVTGARKREVL